MFAQRDVAHSVGELVYRPGSVDDKSRCVWKRGVG